MVGGAVVAHQSGPVDGQHHVQPKQSDVLHDLVIAPLKEGGIQRHHGNHALLRQASGHGNGVLFSDAHIKGPFGKTPLEIQNAGASGHGRGNGTDPVILLRQFFQALAEGIGEGFHLGGQLFSRLGVEFTDAVEFGRVLLGKGIALALLGQHMDQHGLFQIPGPAQQGDQAGQVVAVHRAQIGQTHIFKNGGFQQEPLQPVLQAAAQFIQGLSSGQLLHHPAVDPLGVQIIVTGAQPGQVPGQAAHVPADGHFVVIEDDDHRLAADGGVVHTLIGHASGAGAVADQGHHLVVLAQKRPRPGHTQRDGHRIGGVPGYESVGIALRRLGESGNAAVLPQVRKIRPAAGQQLMDIRLMTHIKNQAVFFCIKNGLDGDAQLHRAQVSGQMAAGLRNGLDQKIPDLLAKLEPLFVA